MDEKADIVVGFAIGKVLRDKNSGEYYHCGVDVDAPRGARDFHDGIGIHSFEP